MTDIKKNFQDELDYIFLCELLKILTHEDLLNDAVLARGSIKKNGYRDLSFADLLLNEDGSKNENLCDKFNVVFDDDRVNLKKGYGFDVVGVPEHLTYRDKLLLDAAFAIAHHKVGFFWEKEFDKIPQTKKTEAVAILRESVDTFQNICQRVVPKLSNELGFVDQLSCSIKPALIQLLLREIQIIREKDIFLIPSYVAPSSHYWPTRKRWSDVHRQLMINFLDLIKLLLDGVKVENKLALQAEINTFKKKLYEGRVYEVYDVEAILIKLYSLEFKDKEKIYESLQKILTEISRVSHWVGQDPGAVAETLLLKSQADILDSYNQIFHCSPYRPHSRDQLQKIQVIFQELYCGWEFHSAAVLKLDNQNKQALPMNRRSRSSICSASQEEANDLAIAQGVYAAALTNLSTEIDRLKDLTKRAKDIEKRELAKQKLHIVEPYFQKMQNLERKDAEVLLAGKNALDAVRGKLEDDQYDEVDFKLEMNKFGLQPAKTESSSNKKIAGITTMMVAVLLGLAAVGCALTIKGIPIAVVLFAFALKLGGGCLVGGTVATVGLFGGNKLRQSGNSVDLGVMTDNVKRGLASGAGS